MPLTALPWKDSFVDLSRRLDDPRVPSVPGLPLGLRAAAWMKAGTFAAFMESVGFALVAPPSWATGLPADTRLWRRGDEWYEPHLGSSAMGFVSIGELDRWARELLARAAAQGTAIALPPITMDLAPAPTRALIDGLLESRATVVFDRGDDPRAQASLARAREILSEPAMLRILADEMRRRGQLDDAGITSLLATCTDPARAELSRLLALRLDRPPMALDAQLRALAGEPR